MILTEEYIRSLIKEKQIDYTPKRMKKTTLLAWQKHCRIVQRDINTAIKKLALNSEAYHHAYEMLHKCATLGLKDRRRISLYLEDLLNDECKRLKKYLRLNLEMPYGRD